MNATIDAIVRRITCFVGVAFGTFAIYLAIGEMTGMTDGTPMDDALSPFVIRLLLKTTVILSAGHAVALAILALARRGFVVPPLARSAMSGVASATALDMVYVSGTWLSAVSERGVFRLVLATSLSLAICAMRSRSSDGEPAPLRSAPAASLRVESV